MYDTDTLIIGAGPTGLTLGIALLQAGHHALLIDDREAQQTTSRAAVVHAHTLEVLESLQVTQRLIDRGLPVATFAVRDRDRALMKIDFGSLPTRYRYTLMISQAVTESVLLQRFTELGGIVLRPRRLTTLTQDEDAVTAHFDSRSEPVELRARYLVGADGMHSTVRNQVGIEFSGGTYQESLVLADVWLTGGVPEGEVILYFSPAGMMVVAPLPGDRYRIVATCPDAPEHPDASLVQHLLDTRGPKLQRAEVADVSWSSRFHVHHRIAADYRSGRVLLAGDAAHVHSPAGGQGMNAGITDAAALANYLSQVLDGAPESTLDGYTAERRPVAEGVIALADRLTRVATVDHARGPRNLGLGLLGRVPGVRNRLAQQLSGLDQRA